MVPVEPPCVPPTPLCALPPPAPPPTSPPEPLRLPPPASPATPLPFAPESGLALASPPLSLSLAPQAVVHAAAPITTTRTARHILARQIDTRIVEQGLCHPRRMAGAPLRSAKPSAPAASNNATFRARARGPANKRQSLRAT